MEVAGDAVAARAQANRRAHGPRRLRLRPPAHGRGCPSSSGCGPSTSRWADADGMDARGRLRPARALQRAGTGSDATGYLRWPATCSSRCASSPRRLRGAPGRPDGPGELPQGQGQPLRRRDRTAALEPVAKAILTGEEDARTTQRSCSGASAALALALPAGAVDLTLYHTWSNESEMAALNTIIERVRRPRRATRSPPPRCRTRRRREPLVSLFVAGNPPNLFIAADAGFYRDLKAKGQARTSGRSSTGSAPPRPSPDGARRRSPSTARC